MKTLVFFSMVECPECADGMRFHDRNFDEVNCPRCDGLKVIEIEEIETVNE